MNENKMSNYKTPIKQMGYVHLKFHIYIYTHIYIVGTAVQN